MDEIETNNVREALKAGAALAEVRIVDGTPLVVVPEGFKVEDLSEHLDTPTRIKRQVKALSLDGFLAYWARANDTAKVGRAAIYVNSLNHMFVAIFDDDQVGMPAWRQHSMIYDCPLSEEWVNWTGNQGKLMPQADFARFIEENLPDIVEPTADIILKLARELEAKRSVDFGQATRLDTGVTSIRFQETINASTTTGEIALPDTFALGIAVFKGGEKYKVPCRLRYSVPRQAGEGLKMGYVIDRPYKLIDAAFDDLVAVIAEKTAQPMIEAVPSIEQGRYR